MVAKKFKFSSTDRSGYKENFPGIYPTPLRMALYSFTTSNPSTVALPLSANNNVVRILNKEVLPAPSGPMTPNNSPCETLKEISLNAVTSFFFPYVLMIFSTTTDCMSFQFYFSIHSNFQKTIILHFYFYSINKIRSLFLCLNCFWRKLCFIRDPNDVTCIC